MRYGRSLRLGIFLVATASSHALAGDGQALQIVVSRNDQTLNVFDGDKVVATTHVSTGKPGHDTPTGIFSILEKEKFHRSNKYSNAPMPWMQRITWSGVALHESNSVPRYPASHGCVRMPGDFAKQLYKMTERGAHVIITDEALTPQRLFSSTLPKPGVSPFSPSFMDDVAMRPGLPVSGKAEVEVAMNDTRETAKLEARAEPPREPVYILITRADHRNIMPDVQALLNSLGYNAGDVDGFSGPQTKAAIAAFRKDNSLPDGIAPDDAFVTALYAKAGKSLPQNGLLVVRRNFAEIYRAEVTIDNEHQALGTHFMEARNVHPHLQMAEWYGMTLSNRIPEAAKRRLGITEDAAPASNDSVVAALERIHMSDETKLELSQLLADGSSITITDVESLSETGLGTNFITLTDPVATTDKG